jgi:hypothetical protein
MPGYIAKELLKFQHPHLKNTGKPTGKAQSTAIRCQGTNDGTRRCSPLLDEKVIKELMAIMGSLLYYGRALDNTLLTALTDLSSAQVKGTEATNAAVLKLLDYCAMHPDAKIRYHGSQMALKIHSDASYLSASKARSRVGGHFYLGNYSKSPNPHMYNGAVLTVANNLKHIMSSAAETELAGLFYNCKESEVFHTTLTEMGWPPLEPTPVAIDNTTAVGIANGTIQ